MSRKKFLNLKGDRKYFAIVFFILFLVLLVGIITPVITDFRENSWDKELEEDIINIENKSRNIFKVKESALLSVKDNLKIELHSVLSPPNTSYRGLIKLVNEDRFSKYSVEVLAPNGRIIAWNEDIAVKQEEIFPLTFPLGQTYFHNTGLITYLSVVDTVTLEHDNFYLVLSVPVEKQYSLQNHYYIPVSLTNELNENFYTQFEISYLPFTGKAKDGRKYSFEILNNYNNKIGVVSFFKPTLSSEINSINQTSGNIQVILVIAAFLLSALGFRKDFRELKFRILKIFVLLVYFSLFRVLLYNFNFPARFLEGELIDPAYFSSAFAGGIVKSPVEFFITAVFFICFAVYIFNNVLEYIKTNGQGKSKFLNLAVILFLIVIFFLSIRGIAASVKSIIFDSAIRYFKEPDLIPDLPAVFMNFNLLIFGLGSILLLCSFLLLIVYNMRNFSHLNKRRNFIIAFVFMVALGIVFYLIQNQPLITPALLILIIGFVILLSYHFYIKGGNTFNYIYATLGASIIFIVLMNHFNLLLERNSLRTVSYELNRPNDNLIRFHVEETLRGAVVNKKGLNLFLKKNTNYDAVAFLIWSNSSLQRESLHSSVSLYNREKEIAGSFYVGIENPVLTQEDFEDFRDGLKIFKPRELIDEYEQVYAGIIEIKEGGIIIGYLSVTVVYDFKLIGNKFFPDFLESGTSILSPVVDVNDLRIFEFTDSKVSRVYGDIYPSRDQVEPIWEAEFSQDNDAWLSLTLNEEEYLTYLTKTTRYGEERVTAVLLKEKQLTWNLFNFFRLFVLHSLFILLLLLIIFIFRFRKFTYSFRGQLLTAFLIISIIPVVVLAIYNREVVQERTRSAVVNELNERLNYLENHIIAQREKHPERDLQTVFANAGRELRISFGAYENTEQVYNSREQFYKSGFFTSKLNPQAYYNLNYLSYREYLTREKIENYFYDSFYKKITVNNHSFSIGVNDAFNKVDIIYSTMDMDVFLFGIYSLAVMIIIIFSTILANNISAPIRKLTKATASVAQGDLNIKLENKERGEIRDLVNGFNKMTSELQKNQIELAELERENAWKEMAKQVAHEIKNPLTPLKLAVQQLVASYKEKSDLPAGKKGKFDIVFEKVTQTILGQIENLSSIATEFSRFAKMPSLKLEEVNLQEVINDTLNLFVDEEVRIYFNSNVESSFIEADNNQLRRMIINLVRNSIQAEATEIRIELKSDNNNFILLFADNGIGIPQVDREKIFNPGFTSKEKGMGIGLKLSKRFLEGIKGNIILLDTSEKGTIFKITIPVIEK